MKLNEIGPKTLDRTAAALKVVPARVKSFFVAVDDILKTLVDAAFFLFLEFEKAKASRPTTRIRLEEIKRDRG